ncbi:hypothetical protein [Bacteroides sp. UBA939]|uniref:hypothetical protein n=1 Tax=Bacteroides sp. UBA939 TaxID=1946092 RepID=UPI0025C06E46|nr:hypothetical protein [Bacteroides sp. UBA939]
MNNIGGIIQCEILGIDDVILFSVVNQIAEIRKKETAEWHTLPINRRNTMVTAAPVAGNAGTLYEHKFSTILPANVVTRLDISRYRLFCINGCILRYTDANGNKRMLGTKDYPLTGTFAEVPEQTAAGLAGYELKLNASEVIPQLPYIEI